MLDIDQVLTRIVVPGLALLPSHMDDVRARLLLLAITLQEDPEQRRRQWPTGPARGLWQFERGGAVRGVLNHGATAKLARAVCAERGIEPTPAAVWPALQHDDLLAAAFARLNLWWDPAPLPAPGYCAAAWNLYLRTWRPGAWSRGSTEQRQGLRAKWDRGYARALGVLQAAGNDMNRGRA